jgi:hypothetical protein
MHSTSLARRGAAAPAGPRCALPAAAGARRAKQQQQQQHRRRPHAAGQAEPAAAAPPPPPPAAEQPALGRRFDSPLPQPAEKATQLAQVSPGLWTFAQKFLASEIGLNAGLNMVAARLRSGGLLVSAARWCGGSLAARAAG